MEHHIPAVIKIAVGIFTVGLAYVSLNPIFIYSRGNFLRPSTSDIKGIFRSMAGVLITGAVVQAVTCSVEAAVVASAIPLCLWSLFSVSGINQRKKRRALIMKELPLLLDYLVLQVESGHAIQQALKSAPDLFTKGSPLYKGLREIDESVQVGSSTSWALEKFGNWLDTSEADVPLMAISQAIQHGTPLANVLREQAKRMREHLILEGEQFANTVSVKILIPLLFFIFPASFLVIFSPVIVALSGRLP